MLTQIPLTIPCGDKLKTVLGDSPANGSSAATDDVIREVADMTYMIATVDIEIQEYITTINGVDLVLQERPRNEIEVRKEISHIQLYLADGSNIIDWQGAGVSGNIGENYVLDASDPTGIGQKLITLDDELTHGATLKVTYRITVNQNSTGIADNTKYTINDYLDVGLGFSQEKNPAWTMIDVNTADCSQEIKDGAKQVVQATTTNGVPLELTLTKVLSVDDEGRYENWCEIATYENPEGRRIYSITPANCNSDPSVTDPASLATQTEVDTDQADLIGIVPPFGKDMSDPLSWGEKIGVEIERIKDSIFKQTNTFLWNIFLQKIFYVWNF